MKVNSHSHNGKVQSTPEDLSIMRDDAVIMATAELDPQPALQMIRTNVDNQVKNSEEYHSAQREAARLNSQLTQDAEEAARLKQEIESTPYVGEGFALLMFKAASILALYTGLSYGYHLLLNAYLPVPWLVSAMLTAALLFFAQELHTGGSGKIAEILERWGIVCFIGLLFGSLLFLNTSNLPVSIMAGILQVFLIKAASSTTQAVLITISPAFQGFVRKLRYVLLIRRISQNTVARDTTIEQLAILDRKARRLSDYYLDLFIREYELGKQVRSAGLVNWQTIELEQKANSQGAQNGEQ